MTEQNPDKDTEDWVTGEEPATGPQLSYLQTLAREAGEEVPADLTKAQASQMIDRLRGRSPRTAGRKDGDGEGTGEDGGRSS